MRSFFRTFTQVAAEEQGQAIAEFALVAGLLVLLLFSMLEVGLALNTKLVLTSVARETARLAAIQGGRTAQVVERMRESLTLAGINPEEVEWVIRPGQAIYGTRITVTLRYRYKLKMPLVAAISGGDIPIQAEVVTRSEYVPR
ncbi:MAG TPA: DUF4320 family protein [Firmicutes bacterium]|nr:DUF4320 family protein [Candidatus Fermentithermobacillaceae bacterium]